MPLCACCLPRAPTGSSDLALQLGQDTCAVRMPGEALVVAAGTGQAVAELLRVLEHPGETLVSAQGCPVVLHKDAVTGCPLHCAGMGTGD